MNPAPRLHIGFARDSVQPLNQRGRSLDDHRSSLYSSLSYEPYEWFSSRHGSSALGLSSQAIRPSINKDLKLANKVSNTPDDKLPLVPAIVLFERDAVHPDGHHSSSVPSIAGLDQFLRTYTTEDVENSSSSISNEDLSFTHRTSQDREKARTPSRKPALNLNGDEQQHTGIYIDESCRTPPGLDTTIQKVGFPPSPVEPLYIIHDTDNINPNQTSDGLGSDVADYQAIQYRWYLSALIAAGYD